MEVWSIVEGRGSNEQVVDLQDRIIYRMSSVDRVRENVLQKKEDNPFLIKSLINHSLNVHSSVEKRLALWL